MVERLSHDNAAPGSRAKGRSTHADDVGTVVEIRYEDRFVFSLS